jgi:predicted amidohydrolase YtcJ
VRGIKLHIDGALGSRGAALLAPYSDSSASRGLLVNTEESLFPILTQALRRGIQIETHAIGDRGNRIMLDLYERAFAAVPVSQRAVAEPRWRIEHAQILQILGTHVLMTIIGGDVVYAAPDAPSPAAVAQ